MLAEIRAFGYPGSANVLTRYLNQGRADQDHGHISPRRPTRLLLTKPSNLSDRQREHRDRITAACPEMTALHHQITAFAGLLRRRKINTARLDRWIRNANAAGPPRVQSFARGLDRDHAAVTAAVTTRHHNGKTEGANAHTKMLKRQMFGRASFPLLRHRILLA